MQRIKYRIKKTLMDNSSAMLITGTGRCGTTFLANALADLHPQIHIEHEIEPTGIGIQNLSFEKQKANIINGRGRFAFREWKRRNVQPAVIESNCFLAPGIQAYLKAWKECKVVGVIRNWDTCIESMASQSFSDNPNFFYADSDHQKERRPNPVRLGLMSSEEWASFCRIEKIAWYWSYVNGHLLDMADKHPESVKLFSFEQMKGYPSAVLQDIQVFFDVPVRTFETNVATNSSKERNQRRLSLDEIPSRNLENIKSIIQVVDKRARLHFAYQNSAQSN